MIRARAALAAMFLLASLVMPACGSGRGEGTLSGRVFDAASLAVMGGATVIATVDGREVARAMTGADGAFEMKVPSGPDVLVKIEQGGHADGLEVAKVPRGGKAHLETFLVSHGIQRTRDADTTDSVKGPRGEGVKLPGAGLVTEDGSPATGSMQVSVTAFDPKARPQLMALPGKQRARAPGGSPGSGQVFRSRGALSVQMTQNGARLQLAPGQTAEIKIPVSDPFAPSTLDLFHLDESTGEWVRVGIARKQRDLAGNEVYSAEVTELSTYAVGSVAPTACVIGCLAAGTEPGTTIVVETVASDFAEIVQTDADGCFRVDVPLGAQVRVRAAAADAIANATTVTADEASTCVDVGVLSLDAAAAGDAVCPLAHVQCPGECVDLGAHPTHCNGCGLSCGTGEQCVDRACTCPATHMLCGTTCTPVQGDPANCGTCGNACGASEECVDGACAAIPCAAPAELCDGYCIDTSSDDDHCGACGRACAQSALCVAGVCSDAQCAVDQDCASDNACVVDTCRPNPVPLLATVTGFVGEDMGGQVFPVFPGTLISVTNANVSVLGANPPITTTTDSSGNFTLSNVPTGVHHILVAGSPGYWGGVTEVPVTQDGASVSIQLHSDTSVTAYAAEVTPTRIVSIANGLVAATFGFQSGSVGGEGATIGAASDPSIVRDAASALLVSPTLFPGGGRTMAFTNVAPGTTTIAASATPGVDACNVFDHAPSPVIAHAMTYVSINCSDEETLSGIVCNDPDDEGPAPCTPILGARVEVLNMTPPLVAMTDATGAFSFQVPIGTIRLHASAAGHWGSIVAWDVFGPTMVQQAIETDAQMAARSAMLGRALDPSHGIATTIFAFVDDLGSESASLNVPSDPPFTRTASGVYVFSNMLLPGVVGAGYSPTLAFPNIRPGLVVPAAFGPSGCTVRSSTNVLEVRPKTTSYAHADCGG